MVAHAGDARPAAESAAPMPFVLALDQGTTSSRALVFDHAGRVVATAQKEFRQIFPEPGWVEHDPTEIWATQSGVMHEALAKAGLSGADVAAIGITNQRETTAPLGTGHGPPARERDRLAGPPDRADSATRCAGRATSRRSRRRRASSSTPTSPGRS